MKASYFNEKYFEDLFREYFRPLVFYALRYLKEKAAAEDIVQDVFVSVYERKEVIQIQSSGINYLYKAVRNRCVDHVRSNKIRAVHSEKIKELFNVVEADPLDQLAIIEFENKYLQALEKLSPKCREVFTLSRMNGKSNSEIAAELKLSKRTVETHISNALKTIRESLKKYINAYKELSVKSG